MISRLFPSGKSLPEGEGLATRLGYKRCRSEKRKTQLPIPEESKGSAERHVVYAQRNWLPFSNRVLWVERDGWREMGGEHRKREQSLSLTIVAFSPITVTSGRLNKE